MLWPLKYQKALINLKIHYYYYNESRSFLIPFVPKYLYIPLNECCGAVAAGITLNGNEEIQRNPGTDGIKHIETLH